MLEDLLKIDYEEVWLNKILDGYHKKRYTTFRINSLKSSKEEVLENLKKHHFEVEAVSWYDKAFILKNKSLKELQELEIYQKGSIYVQSLSSMLPVLILNPKENEFILDMAAAPGSKTTQMATETNNKSMITACEINKIRIERLKYNLSLQKATCVTILNEDATKLNESFSFDKILLDAPCSGSGTISLEENQPIFSKERLEKIRNTEIKLLRKALSILKPGEKMIYSTCSILKQENESVLQTLQKEFSFTLLPIFLPKTIPQLPSTLPNTITILPNEYFEGFFLAYIEKK